MSVEGRIEVMGRREVYSLLHTKLNTILLTDSEKVAMYFSKKGMVYQLKRTFFVENDRTLGNVALYLYQDVTKTRFRYYIEKKTKEEDGWKFVAHLGYIMCKPVEGEKMIPLYKIDENVVFGNPKESDIEKFTLLGYFYLSDGTRKVEHVKVEESKAEQPQPTPKSDTEPVPVKTSKVEEDEDLKWMKSLFETKRGSELTDDQLLKLNNLSKYEQYGTLLASYTPELFSIFPKKRDELSSTQTQRKLQVVIGIFNNMAHNADPIKSLLPTPLQLKNEKTTPFLHSLIEFLILLLPELPEPERSNSDQKKKKKKKCSPTKPPLSLLKSTLVLLQTSSRIPSFCRALETCHIGLYGLLHSLIMPQYLDLVTKPPYESHYRVNALVLGVFRNFAKWKTFHLHLLMRRGQIFEKMNEFEFEGKIVVVKHILGMLSYVSELHNEVINDESQVEQVFSMMDKHAKESDEVAEFGVTLLSRVSVFNFEWVEKRKEKLNVLADELIAEFSGKKERVVEKVKKFKYQLLSKVESRATKLWKSE